MILYLDGPALVLLFVQLENSEEVRRRVDAAVIVASSVISYAEVTAAFANLDHRGSITSREHDLLRSELDRDWPHVLKMEVSEPVWRPAAELASRYLLAATESLHLASYLTVAATNRPQATALWSPDERLRLAAQAAVSEEAASEAGTKM